MTPRSVSIIMPAFNAEKHIEQTIERISADLWQLVRNIWVINDGSVDKTGAIVDAMAITKGEIRPVHFKQNLGYGAALKKGLMLCKDDGCLAAVCLHADGQYPPEAICHGVDAMVAGAIDILQGSRIASGTALSGGMPLYKFIANKTLTFLENRVFGLSLTDYHSGMLFYGRKALDALPFATFSDSFDFDVEVIACGRAKGLSIGEIPIPTRYGTEISHVRSIPYGFRVVNVLLKYATGRYCSL
jgi:glycosyltransferase involved in cell wall biosynthesis